MDPLWRARIARVADELGALVLPHPEIATLERYAAAATPPDPSVATALACALGNLHPSVAIDKTLADLARAQRRYVP